MTRIRKYIPIFMTLVIIFFNGLNFVGLFIPFFKDYAGRDFKREKASFVDFVDKNLQFALTDAFLETIESGSKRDEYSKLRKALSEYDLSPRLYLRSSYQGDLSGKPGVERITYQISRGTRFALLEITLSGHDGKDYITNITVQPLPDDIRRIQNVTFSDASAWHYTILLINTLAMLGLLYTIYDLFHTNIPKKHIWLFAFMFGICRLSLSWASGDVEFHALSLGLDYFGFSQRGLRPWTMDTRLPIGLVFYWLRGWDFAGFITGRATTKNGA